MKIKYIVLIFCAFLLWNCSDQEIALAPFDTEIDTTTINFKHNKFSNALKEAKEMKKPIFLYFTVDDCSWSTKMEEEVFTDTTVQSFINEKFICSKIEIKRSPEASKAEDFMKSKESKIKILKQYEIGSSCPAYVIIDPNGKLRKKDGGYMDIQEFMKFVKKV